MNTLAGNILKFALMCLLVLFLSGYGKTRSSQLGNTTSTIIENNDGTKTAEYRSGEGKVTRIASASLFTVIMMGNLAEVKTLVANGADVNKRKEDVYPTWGKVYSTPLSTAMMYLGGSEERMEIFRILIASGADVNSRAGFGNTTPLESISSFNPKVFEKLSKGTVLNFQQTVKNNKEALKLLIDKKANVNAKNLYGDTPLHRAIAADNLGTVKYLVDHEADINSADNLGFKPLHVAKAFSHKEIIDYLVARRADYKVSGESGQGPLIKAILEYDKAQVAKLVSNGADVSKKDNKGNAPLFYAICLGSTEIVDVLLSHGADTSGVKKYTQPYLILSLRNYDIAKLLLEKGSSANTSHKVPTSVKPADKVQSIIDAASGLEKTALTTSIYLGNIDVVKLLIKHGADVNLISGKADHGPLVNAIMTKNEEIAVYLIERGADIHKKYGLTNYSPLHWAVSSGLVKVTDKLIASGANVNAKGGFGSSMTLTPLDVAVIPKNGKFVKLLIDHGGVSGTPEGQKRANAMVNEYGEEHASQAAKQENKEAEKANEAARDAALASGGLLTPNKSTVAAIKSKAENGEPYYQAVLGGMYRGGKYVEKDYQTSINWLERAGDHPIGLYYMALMYRDGYGVTKNEQKEQELYKKSVAGLKKWSQPGGPGGSKGSAIAQAILSSYLSTGTALDKNLSESVEWIRKAAEQGYAKAQVMLGQSYKAGSGVPQDYAEALKWNRKSAEQGNAIGQYMLGAMYAQGEGVSEDVAEGYRWIRKAAEQGYSDGQFSIGQQHYHARGGIAKNYVEAGKWYHKAAEQGHNDAQYVLGLMYGDGKGVSKDYTKAAQFYRKAADQGNHRAQINLANLYQNGRGVPQNGPEAEKLLKEAAKKGVIAAEYGLGGLYYEGKLVPQDIIEAAKWFRKAADQGYGPAVQMLKRIGAQ
jgi:TPR repeat protein/ankyrin repeat protein